MRSVTLALVLLSSAFAGWSAIGAPAAVAAQDEYPTTATEAEELYESDPDTWLDGPPEYLILRDEREIWDDLESTEQRQAFIDWFWARRDDDPRAQEHEFRKEFYERVAYSNERFRGFPRGWKSDRGRVWIIIGRPDSISRRSWFQVVGRGNGPDFEVWTYYTNLRDRGFRAQFGEYPVYFIETRPGRPEIWDYRFGAGSYPPDLRRAFEYANEHAIVDQTTEFEAGSTEAGFVRAVTESDLPMEVPLESWGDPASGGIVALPARIRLGDLLFTTADDGFRATLEMEAALVDDAGDIVSGGRKEWVVALSADELGAHGNGSLLLGISLEAEPGTYEARVAVREPLAEASASWEGGVEVDSAAGGANIAVGSLALDLGEDLNAGVGVVGPADAVFEAGDAADIVVVGWLRERVEDAELVGLRLVRESAEDVPLEVAGSRWVSGAGQLVVDSRLPADLEEGDYEIVLSLRGQDVARVPLTIDG